MTVRTQTSRRWPFWLALAALLAGALALRLWGIKHGLPYAYNVDESTHFVPRAVGFFGHDYNPHYFVNPPAFTYLLHGVFGVWFGGRDGVARAYAGDPTEVLVVARAASAVAATSGVALLCATGARLFDRRVGLLAAALLSVAFLPVFYSHLALNDAPLLAPVGLSLFGSAGILRHGRRRDYMLAGAGLGLAFATKYTAAIVLLPLLGAAACASSGRVRWGRGVGLALVAGLGCAVLAHPYAVLDAQAFIAGLGRQSSASATSKLGLTEPSGHLYYLWTLTWGVGWVPALAAGGGALWLVRSRPPAAALLVPAPLAFVVYMGAHERYFGRWLMPILPIVCLLAAVAAVAAVDAAARRRPRLRAPALAVMGLGLIAQGVVFSVHNDAVLARDDTRALTRSWLLDHVPAGSAIVVEPVVPETWLHDLGRPSALTSDGSRWVDVGPSMRADAPSGDLFSRLPAVVASKRLPDGQALTRVPRPPGVVGVESYVRTLSPALLDRYERAGACWVVSGSTQSDRAFAEPARVPSAIAYYAALRRRARVAYRASPVGPGGSLGAFNFDWSFNAYPLSRRRAGPLVTIYRLTRGRCR